MSDAMFALACFVIVALIGTVIVAVARDAAINHAAFMSECLADHKQYECTAMWRHGHD